MSSVQLRLNVPFHCKDRAKMMGAKWDILGKFWYVPHRVDVIQFREWWPEGLEKEVQAMNDRANEPKKKNGEKGAKAKNKAKVKKSAGSQAGGGRHAPKFTGPKQVESDGLSSPPWE